MSNNNQSRPAGAWSDRIGYVRLAAILAPAGPLPISKSTWWAGVKAGRYPKPIKFGPRITAWKIADICDLIARANGEVR